METRHGVPKISPLHGRRNFCGRGQPKRKEIDAYSLSGWRCASGRNDLGPIAAPPEYRRGWKHALSDEPGGTGRVDRVHPDRPPEATAAFSEGEDFRGPGTDMEDRSLAYLGRRVFRMVPVSTESGSWTGAGGKAGIGPVGPRHSHTEHSRIRKCPADYNRNTAQSTAKRPTASSRRIRFSESLPEAGPLIPPGRAGRGPRCARDAGGACPRSAKGARPAPG